MGEAKRRKQRRAKLTWPSAESDIGVVDLHTLSSVAAVGGARLRELTGDQTIPPETRLILRAFRAVAGDRSFNVGFCVGGEHGVSAVGIAVIERTMLESRGAVLHVVPVVHPEIAWDIVLRHLRTFTGRVLLFVFPDSDVYDAGVAEISYSVAVRQFTSEGTLLARLTEADRRRIKAQGAALLGRPPPPPMYAVDAVVQSDAPWIFRLRTATGKELRTAVWDGRRGYAHELPPEIIRWVGGEKIAIVQVEKPVGIDRRSSLDLTHKLAKDFDGIVHWARDSATFQSIVKSFVRLDLESATPPVLPDGWAPKVTILAANSSVAD